MVHFPKRDLSEASLALERGDHLTKLLARLSVYLADEASSQHRRREFLEVARYPMPTLS
jgi:hypothetical protein